MKDQIWQWFLIACGAGFGIMTRVGNWRRMDNTMDWWKAVGECLTIPAIASLVSGGVEYIDPHMVIQIKVALSTLAGVIGVAAIEALALKFLSRKVEGG